jgi:Tfp pilus assembly protein PilN
VATYTDPTIIQLGDKPRILTGAWLLLAAGILAFLAAGLFFFQSTRARAHTNTLTTEIAADNATLQTLQPTADALVQLDRTAKNLHILFDNQKRWEAILGTVEQRFYKNMVITTLQFSENGSVSFAGTTPTYTDYAKIFRSLTDADGTKYFSSAHPGAISKIDNKEKNISGVSFSFTLVLQPTITKAQAVLFLTDLSAPATTP